MTATEPNTHTTTTGIGLAETDTSLAATNGQPERKFRYSPAVIAWAREEAERNGQTGLCDRFPDLKAWEQGSKLPSSDQMSEFAEAIYMPYAYLICDEPREKEDNPSGGFYTPAGLGGPRVSWNLRDTLDDLLLRQDWLRGYRAWSDADLLEFVGRAGPSSTPLETARDILEALGLEPGWTTRCASYATALAEFRRRAWELGVATTIDDVVEQNPDRRLNPSEFRGFALSNRWAPFVFVNGAVPKPAQTHTLVHELVHIWLGQSCTCLDVLDHLALTGEPGCAVEAFCNETAAELLAPAEAVRAAWQQLDATPGQAAGSGNSPAPRQAAAGKLTSLATRFKLSRLVMAYRACSLELLPWSALAELRQDPKFVNHRPSPATQHKQSYTDQQFYDLHSEKVGQEYAKTVLEARRYNYDTRETMDLLGLTWGLVESYEEHLGIKR